MSKAILNHETFKIISTSQIGSLKPTLGDILATVLFSVSTSGSDGALPAPLLRLAQPG